MRRTFRGQKQVKLFLISLHLIEFSLDHINILLILSTLWTYTAFFSHCFYFALFQSGLVLENFAFYPKFCIEGLHCKL